MAEKHLKKCSTSLVLVRMEIKTTLTFHLQPVRMSKISNKIDISRSREHEACEPSFIAAGRANLYSHCGNQNNNFSEY